MSQPTPSLSQSAYMISLENGESGDDEVDTVVAKQKANTRKHDRLYKLDTTYESYAEAEAVLVGESNWSRKGSTSKTELDFNPYCGTSRPSRPRR